MFRVNVIVLIDDEEICNYIEDCDREIDAVTNMRNKIAEFTNDIKWAKNSVMLTSYISVIEEAKETFKDKLLKAIKIE